MVFEATANYSKRLKPVGGWGGGEGLEVTLAGKSSTFTPSEELLVPSGLNRSFRN